MYAVISMDGNLCREDGDIDWILEQDNPLKTDYGMKNFFDSVDTILMNRNYYFWLLGYDLCFSHLLKPCIMITEDDSKVAGNYEIEYVRIPTDDYSKAVESLKLQKKLSGGDIWLAGDNKLIWAFLDEDMVDEIVLTMLPVTIGRGVKLFPDSSHQRKWFSWNKKYYDNGVVQVTYRTTPKNQCN